MDAKPADNQPQWLEFYQQHIVPFWQTMNRQWCHGRDEVKLHWVYHKVSETAPLVVVSPGRIEATIKYQELAWDLAQAGISIAIVDHRGQGHSERLTANPHQGHVDNFSDFVDDFAIFQRQIDAVFPQRSRAWLVAHSMGGAIASLYCAHHQHPYQQLILSAPMLSINTGGIPNRIAQWIAGAGSWLNQRLAPGKPWYFVGMGDYQPDPFNKNQLTHSQQRYQLFRQQYQDDPEVQLGGPTFDWLYESLLACRAITRDALGIGCPVTLFQAQQDSVVTPKGQDRFAALNSNVTKQVIAGAKHELLMESDEYRQVVVDKLLQISVKGD